MRINEHSRSDKIKSYMYLLEETTGVSLRVISFRDWSAHAHASDFGGQATRQERRRRFFSRRKLLTKKNLLRARIVICPRVYYIYTHKAKHFSCTYNCWNTIFLSFFFFDEERNFLMGEKREVILSPPSSYRRSSEDGNVTTCR